MSKKNCIKCKYFKKRETYGECTKFGWEIDLELSKRERVCEE